MTWLIPNWILYNYIKSDASIYAESNYVLITDIY